VKQRNLVVAGTLLTAVALVLTACGDGGDGGGGADSSGGAEGANSNAQITAFNTKPQKSLIPGNTQEEGGLTVLAPLFRGLVAYSSDSSEPTMAMAESIDSPDSIVWTIKLKAGQTFQDGTPVTSDSFIDAWNWTAYGPNATLNNYYFDSIKGYDDLNPADPDGEGPKPVPKPKVTKMSGLKKVSDTEFVVTLASPESIFKIKLGYLGFSPLPKKFFDDPEAFGKKPIGNGPFQFVSGDGDTGFVEKRWDGYKGADAAKISQVTYKTYTSPGSAYSDLVAGNLDFMTNIPPANLVKDQYKKDLEGRALSVPLGQIGTMAMPWYDPKYRDPNLNKALSLSIDRAAITKNIFNNGRTPATGWVSPVVAGYKPNACGEFCTYNPTLAKEYFAKAKFKGPFTFATNFDGPGNKESADAICNSIRKSIGATCTPKSYVDFGAYRTDITAKKMTSMFRTTWNMDYPSIQNFLKPLYYTSADANDGSYSNKQFDALIDKGDAETGDAAVASYQQAEVLLKNDMAVIPLWYIDQQSGWSPRLSNVKIEPTGTLDVSSVTATS
jgi:oligopeptide transport system substrate-binding protein